MTEFKQYLSQESLDALSALSQSRIQTLLSGAGDIRVGQCAVTVQSVSIPIDNGRFVIVENDWSDTPEEGLDYYFLSVRLASSPRDVYYDPSPAPGGANYRADHLSLHLGAAAHSSRIDVLVASETGTTESTSYDAGLVIAREDGTRIAIVREPSISGSLVVAHSEEDAVSLTAEMTKRLSLRP